MTPICIGCGYIISNDLNIQIWKTRFSYFPLAALKHLVKNVMAGSASKLARQCLFPLE